MNKGMKIGLIGAGNLGTSLLKYLVKNEGIVITISDLVDNKAKEASKTFNCEYATVSTTIKEADIIFLALPPNVICSFVEDNENIFKKGSIIINLSTSVDTKTILNGIERKDIEIIGLKPVCQSTAFAQGSKIVFLSSSSSDKLEILRELLSEAGNIIIADEMKVQKINEYATLRALELIIQVKKDLEEFQVSEEILECAICTVALGTLMDYPYTKDNYNDYITRIVKKYELDL